MNIIVKFKSLDLSEATVSLKVFEDPDHGLHNVIRSLPAGLDIGPDIWRYMQSSAAERKFSEECKRVESLGFKEIARVSL